MKYFFVPIFDEWCPFTLDEILSMLHEEGLESVEAYEAIDPYNDPDYMYCSFFREVLLRTTCSSNCTGYSPRNGRSGICRHHYNRFYKKGKPVKISLNHIN